jgi:alkyl hydroperoxide reductase subunit AhpF
MVVEMDEATKEQVSVMFAGIENDVSIHLFIKDHECLYCSDTTTLVNLIADLSDKVKVVVHKDPLTTGKAAEWGVKYHPAIVLHGKGEYKVRFYGIPAGHEFGALVG